MEDHKKIVNYKFYSFFTKYSIMENHGFFAGFFIRIFRKFIPQIPEQHTFEFYLNSELNRVHVIDVVDTLTQSLAIPEYKIGVTKDLDNAISGLSSQIISYGFDYEFQAFFDKLDINSQCYKELLNQANALSKNETIEIKKFQNILDEVSNTIEKLRDYKNITGTSLHLTVVIKNLLNYVKRIKILLDLKNDIGSKKKWEYLINDYLAYNKSKNSLRDLLASNTDLLAFEIVEHTAQKGEKYVAENTKEYFSFFKKGLLGGLIISIFTLFKIIIDSNLSEPLPLAFLYSINYALCFVIVYFLGGTIATKQPAMTASTIAKHIDKDGDNKFHSLNSIILLLRKISRSQFISLLGNFVMAFSFSCLIAFLFTLIADLNPVSTEKSIKLIEQVFPFSGGAIYYAAIAGVFLSVSGFISGYFDNKVKTLNLAYRIQHNEFLTGFLSGAKIRKIAAAVERNLGVYAGNISLGFFLGSAFLLSYVTPFNIDIRHIAFSSANVGYGVINNTFSVSTILMAVGSVFIIGLINFLVSFSMTFLLVLKSRGLKISSLGRLLRLSLKDFMSNPLDYVIIRSKRISK
ncbi:hypothetical protein FEZ18_09930 [Oceanihabitans sp. IOP_32]|uniref:hypothetical protein n=1 Tax=Oceanihabitans sp. IOP_32 TaxID=2529032 RepID=UPI0012936923|nr:hypothetical protein [Oceanihabitans sp. IOP_32]QFZ55087.1 hypothetical protein FEZ18_09930 [Oceanihabitans sp. IOP_32]